jgi:hypothetical protein
MQHLAVVHASSRITSAQGTVVSVDLLGVAWRGPRRCAGFPPLHGRHMTATRHSLQSRTLVEGEYEEIRCAMSVQCPKCELLFLTKPELEWHFREEHLWTQVGEKARSSSGEQRR